ncbi:MAG: DUF1343 domain-containing protein [Flavobacteriales bacterium]|nr:DUF1343 domain-containing protein [Flavobacteriales bacterium]
MMIRLLIFFLLSSFCSLGQMVIGNTYVNDLKADSTIEVGALAFDKYLPLLAGKSVGVVANHTSMLGEQHLVDVLLSKKVDIEAVFAPEHGFRGKAANGEKVESGKDAKTGLIIHSLYGKTKKPSNTMLVGVDVMIFDMQDVGARFYTYLSTMHYVMEACAENQIPVIILDRPNPNGFYIDGPVLQPTYSSFVGMHPIPIVHGMTLGELAQMINGEGWLDNSIKCDLTVVPCANYDHNDLYELPVNPSPNLTSQEAIYLYPSLCLFEPTKVSIGRGTDFPFEVIGHPSHEYGSFSFTPEDRPGKSVNPKHEGKECRGQNLNSFGEFYFTSHRSMYLEWLVAMYEFYPDKASFFTSANFFDKLAGTDELRKQIVAGKSAEEIQQSWQEGLMEFRSRRLPYLIYAD